MKVVLTFIFTLIAGIVSAADFERMSLPASLFVAETPEISIWLPLSYTSSSTERYPVVYVLDGKLNGALVSAMLQRLHASNGVNEHIVVGVSSDERLRDFAPTVNQDPRGPVGAGGGGEQFLDLMQKELMPAIKSKYRANEYAVIVGHSIAGLLVIHSFQSRPELFQAHLAFSPAVWWGARETAQATKQYVISSKYIKNYLYMGIGNEGGEMRQVYDALAQTILRNRNVDLFLQLDELDNESHDFTLAAGLYNALKGLHKYQQKHGM